jgi:hypothetical protein
VEHSISPDVKLVKTRSSFVQTARYLGAVTRCKSLVFETCTKRCARQSGFGAAAAGALRLDRAAIVSLYKFAA